MKKQCKSADSMAYLHMLVLPSMVLRASLAFQNTLTTACMLNAEGRENRAVFRKVILTEQTF